MKQYLYITLLLLSCWGVSAQNRVEALYTYPSGHKTTTEFHNLKSRNGKYVFESEVIYDDGNQKHDQYNWVIKNIISNEITFRTKNFFVQSGSTETDYPFYSYNYCPTISVFLHFNTIDNFNLINCSTNEKGKGEIEKHYPGYGVAYTLAGNFAAPYISVSGSYCAQGDSSKRCVAFGTISIGDLFGIESAQSNIQTYNTNPELASAMVYQDRGDGWYTVPEYYHAKALLLTDEGDLQIVNTKEQVIWSLKQSQQDDKHFIAKGNTDPIQTASLIHTPEGHIELSNSKYQQEFDLTFLAKDYVLLSASNNKASELSVTSPNSMISMQVYQDSPTTSTAKSGLTSKSSTAKISPTEAPKLLVIPDQKNGITNVIKKTTKTAKTAKTVKIEKPMPTNSFTVFPNPVKDIINIVFDDTTETLTKLQILSLDGRIIREFTGSQTPNIQELSSGMYLYLIESTKNKYNGKIIKQ